MEKPKKLTELVKNILIPSMGFNAIFYPIFTGFTTAAGGDTTYLREFKNNCPLALGVVFGSILVYGTEQSVRCINQWKKGKADSVCV